MSPLLGFGLSFGLTLVLLGAVAWTGKRRRVRVHVTCVALTLASLAWTIHEAYGVGAVYDLSTSGAVGRIHLLLAKVTTAAFLAPLATGILSLRRARLRSVHRKVAWSVLLLTVVSAATGVWMMALATPR